MGDAVDAPRQTSVFIVGGGPVGLAMALLLDRFGIDACRREEPDHDRSSQVARLLGAHHGDLPAVGHRAGDPRPRPAGQLRHVRVQVESIAGREFGRSRPEPNLGHTPAWKCLVAQDAVEEEFYRVIEHSNLVPPCCSRPSSKASRKPTRRRLRDPLGRHRPSRALARQVPARLRRRRQPRRAAPPASRWSGRDARRAVERVLARRPLALPAGARGGGLPCHPERRPACRAPAS